GFDKHNYLATLKRRTSLLQPATAKRLEGVLVQLEESLKPENEKKTQEKIAKLIEKASQGDAAAKAEMIKMRVISVDNFVIATTNPITFFDTVPLANNEVPFIENTSRQEIVVSYLGQDGRARKTQPIRYQGQGQVELHTISTEEFEYVIRDIYSGEVKTAQLANVDLARDVELQLNKLMWPFIKSAIGAFVTTGPRALRTFFPHSIVNTKNLPTTNLLVAPGNTNTSLWRKECMDVVLEYAAAWGNSLDNAFGGGVGQMKPTAVYIPSSEVMGYLQQVQLTSFGNSVVEEIFDTGFVLNYGGARWVFIADATLDPDEGLAYVKFNKPIGTFFTKPGLDQTFEDESIGMRKQNKGSVSMNKVIGFGLPINWRLNVAAVRYHNAR
ncbi:MAG TPA: hypothetical protein VH188_03580, partial [Chthoniobacterales bacterium]|nr:hypothetical protein [Chthoniobacterales bacterium]